ncbi:MAG: hypothetical protein ACKVPY_08015 [Paracoccaceae bacterium]
MRDFFINSLEKILNVLVVVAFLALVVVAGIAATGGHGPMGEGGPLAGLLLLVLGAVYLVIVFGFMFLGLGIYQNTKRMADALERK